MSNIVLQTDKVILQTSNIASLINKTISPTCNIVHPTNKTVLRIDTAMLSICLVVLSARSASRRAANL